MDEVDIIEMIQDHKGRSKGIAFVTFEDEKAVKKKKEMVILSIKKKEKIQIYLYLISPFLLKL